MIEAQFTYQKKLFTWTSLGAIRYWPSGTIADTKDSFFIEDATTIRDALRVIRSFCTGLDHARANSFPDRPRESRPSDPLSGSVSDRCGFSLANPTNTPTPRADDEL